MGLKGNDGGVVAGGGDFEFLVREASLIFFPPFPPTFFPGQGSGLGFSLSGGPSALTPGSGLRGAGGLISSWNLRSANFRTLCVQNYVLVR